MYVYHILYNISHSIGGLRPPGLLVPQETIPELGNLQPTSHFFPGRPESYPTMTYSHFFGSPSHRIQDIQPGSLTGGIQCTYIDKFIDNYII